MAAFHLRWGAAVVSSQNHNECAHSGPKTLVGARHLLVAEPAGYCLRNYLKMSARTPITIRSPLSAVFKYLVTLDRSSAMQP